MKSVFNYLGFIFLFCAQIFLQCEIRTTSAQAADNSWKNIYGISWTSDAPAEEIRYAKQMGYDYIVARTMRSADYTQNPDAAGLKYYISGPWQLYELFSGLSSSYQQPLYIDTTLT